MFALLLLVVLVGLSDTVSDGSGHVSAVDSLVIALAVHVDVLGRRQWGRALWCVSYCDSDGAEIKSWDHLSKDGLSAWTLK